MDRKSFIQKTTGAMLIGIPFFSMLSCSDSDNDPVPDSADKDCLLNGTNSSVSSNHGHSVTVSKADVEAGVDKQYSIQGSSDHNHTITVSASEFSTLKINQQVQVTSSSGGGHNHSVTISCA